MADPRYAKDVAYQDEVKTKLAKSVTYRRYMYGKKKAKGKKMLKGGQKKLPVGITEKNNENYKKK